jgi:hypothetical protein
MAIIFDTPTTSTTTGMHVRIYLENRGFAYDDDQHVDYRWDQGLYSDDFHNDFGPSGGIARLRFWDGSISVQDSTYKIPFAGTVSGVFNGTSPHVSGEKTVPKRAPRAPSAPTQNNPSLITSSSVRVNYSLNSSNGAAVEKTQVQRAQNSGFSTGVLTRTDSSGFNAYDGHDDLTRATQYWTRVRALNSAGWSDWSNTRSFTTAATVPDRPAAPVVTNIQTNRVDIGYGTLPSNGGSSFTNARILVELASDGSNIRDITDTTDLNTPFIVTGLTRATDYTVRTWLRNSVGQSLQSPITSFSTLPTVATAPRNLRFTSRGITAISVAWDAPSDDGGRTIDYYIVQRSTSSNMSSPTQIQTSNLSATFSGLIGGTRYYFRVYSHTSAGNGSFSEIINTTTFPAVAGEPYEVLAQPTSVQFAWEPVSGATQYEWELLTSPTTGVVATGLTSGTGPITVGSLSTRTSYYARVRVTQPEVGSYSDSTEITTIIPMRGWGGTGWVHHLATYGWDGDGWVEADEVFGWDGSDWQPVQEGA